MSKRALTEAQEEIIRFLGLGEHIYFDKRGKFRLTASKRADGTRLAAKTGHRDIDERGGVHLQRPSVEILLDLRLLKGEFDECARPQWTLNHDNKEYAEEIQMLIAEGALGVTRQ